MSHILFFDSPECQHIRREQRIHEMSGVKGASAVHLVFDSHNFIVKRGKLSDSIAEARRLVHLFMEQHDAKMSEQFNAGVPASSVFHPHATLQPITTKRTLILRARGRLMLDPAEYRACYTEIVHTCYEVIRDSDDPEVRMQAAHLLQSVGVLPEDMQ